MTGSVRGRVTGRAAARSLAALGAAALLTLLTLGAMWLGGAFGEHAGSRPSAPSAGVAADHGPKPVDTSAHTLRPQVSLRARALGFAILPTAFVVAAGTRRLVRPVRAGRQRAVRVTGLPPGRAPPSLRVV